MDMYSFGKKIICQLLVMSFVLTGCLPSDVASTRRSESITPGNLGGGNTNGAGSGDDAADADDSSITPKIEIRHLIEPNLSTSSNYSSGTGLSGGGSYVRKLTLPKNFAGRLYLAGINIGTLSDRFVTVRFKFGMNREVVTVPATVSKAPGITPDTDISVLIMDLRSEPFRNIRLPYDLFDYNEYNFDNGDEPTQNNLDTGLYCRGLQIADDPTFQGVGACDGVQSNSSQPAEECLYAYAKVKDQGLIKVSNSVKVPLTPSMSQTSSILGVNYYQDYMNYKILKPLPDTMPTTAANIAGNFTFSQLNSTYSSTAITFTYPTSIWDPVTILGSQYYYRGPYRLVDSANWQFKFSRLDGEKRLFRQDSWVNYPLYLTNPLPDDNQTTPTQSKIYYNSYLFPLATKLDLDANVSHLASSDVLGTRTAQTLSIAGDTLWMDGSNARAQSYNSDYEHIGSCNVSATIEILAKDENLNQYVVSVANDVKLQLVRPAQYQTSTGDDVLYSNFKTCASNSQCGSGECCFNSRCWDENLVSQCYDSSASEGNRNIGESCTTDLQCSSLCCNSSSGLCSPHNTVTSPAVLCSKPIGNSCIAKEWCAKSPVTTCLIVKTGTNPQTGANTCRQQCYTTEEYGDCKNGVCVAPVQPTIAPFDPDAPGACDDAVAAPSF